MLILSSFVFSVGYECSGCGSDRNKNVPCEALDLCIRAVKAGGKIGTPGVFMPMDPEGKQQQTMFINEDSRNGSQHINITCLFV